VKIKVKLFATLRNGREKEMLMDFEESMNPRGIIEILNINEADIAILLINGRDGELDRELVDGDTVSIFPPVGGG
jgi:sulfur-carrier protein